MNFGFKQAATIAIGGTLGMFVAPFAAGPINNATGGKVPAWAIMAGTLFFGGHLVRKHGKGATSTIGVGIQSAGVSAGITRLLAGIGNGNGNGETLTDDGPPISGRW